MRVIGKERKAPLYRMKTFAQSDQDLICSILYSIIISNYSKTSMARTPITRLPWLIRNHFGVPRIFFLIAQDNKYLEIF